MGRPPGIKNGQGKKAAKAPKKGVGSPSAEKPREASQMGAAVQSNGPTPEEKRKYLEEYRNHRRRLADIMKEAADERGNGRSTLKAFENKGGSPKMLRRMWELTDMSKGEAESEIAEYLGYAIDIGIRVVFDASGQGGFADVMEPTTEAMEATARGRSYDEGWERAKNGGQVTENPKPQGSEQHQRWHQGFQDYHWQKENGPSPASAAEGADAADETAAAAD